DAQKARTTLGIDAPVFEIPEWLMPLQRGDVLAPFLRLRFKIRRTKAATLPADRVAVDAEGVELAQDIGRIVIRAGFPEPVRRRLGVVAEPLLTLEQCAFGPLALAVFFLQVAEEAGILQGNDGLRSQQIQYGNPLRRKGAGGQTVLQIEQPDQLGLAKNWHAQHGLRLLPREIGIRHGRVWCGGIGQDDLLPAAPDMIE